MILTSNFKTCAHLPQAVAICRGVPRGWRGRRAIALAPSWEMVKSKLLPEAWMKVYRAQVLDKLDPQQIIQGLGGDNFIMLCWEAPGEFCHRRIVAVWMEAATGIKIPEYDPGLREHQEWVRGMQKLQ